MARQSRSRPGKTAPRKRKAAAKGSARTTRAARRAPEQVFEGLAVSPGIAIGPARYIFRLYYPLPRTEFGVGSE